MRSVLSSSLSHLGQAGLAVHDEAPVLGVHTVRHLVLPDEGPVVGGGPRGGVPSPGPLGDDSTHRLGHAQVDLQRETRLLLGFLRLTHTHTHNNSSMWLCLKADVPLGFGCLALAAGRRTRRGQNVKKLLVV